MVCIWLTLFYKILLFNVHLKLNVAIPHEIKTEVKLMKKITQSQKSDQRKKLWKEIRESAIKIN